jgi:hypothetical protein
MVSPLRTVCGALLQRRVDDAADRGLQQLDDLRVIAPVEGGFRRFGA